MNYLADVRVMAFQVLLVYLYCGVLHDFILLQLSLLEPVWKPCYILYMVSFGLHFYGINNLLLKVALLGSNMYMSVFGFWVISVIENVLSGISKL